MTQPTESLPVPLIDHDRCIGCGTCVDVCPNEALAMNNHKVVVARSDQCDYTGYCERICPTQAIERPFQIIYLLELCEPIAQVRPLGSAPGKGTSD